MRDVIKIHIWVEVDIVVIIRRKSREMKGTEKRRHGGSRTRKFKCRDLPFESNYPRCLSTYNLFYCRLPCCSNQLLFALFD